MKAEAGEARKIAVPTMSSGRPSRRCGVLAVPQACIVSFDQSFFVGDGLTGTGTGTVQRFVIPEGATALYLGFADGNYFAGDPSWYSDNTGSIALQVTQKRR